MGGAMTKLEGGRKKPETTKFNDKAALRTIGKVPKKITHLRVWYQTHIVAFECFYDNISAGARIGSEFVKAEPVDVVLEETEHIRGLVGSYTAGIDHLTFHTTKGRIIMIGQNKGGRFFSLKPKELMIVKVFQVGFSKYMDTIRASFQKLKPARDLYSHRSTETTLGRQFAPVARLLPRDNVCLDKTGFVEKEEMKVGDLPAMNHNPARMHSKYVSYTSPANEEEKDPLGENLVSSGIATSAGTISNAFSLNRSYASQPTISKILGKSFPDTVVFDDYKNVLQAHACVILNEIRVAHDKHFVYGIECVYLADNKMTSGGIHWGSVVHEDVLFESVSLHFGETVSSVSWKYGDSMTGLVITTSTGKVYSFGSNSQGDLLHVDVPVDRRVMGVAGGVGSHLHHLWFYLC